MIDETINIFSKPETTKEMIISILSEEFPLSLQKIKIRLSKKYQKNISYQGTYKELNKLLGKNILVKEGKEYLLNKNWILDINKISKHIYLNYTKASNYSLTLFEKLRKEGDSLILNFNSIQELDEYFVSIMNNLNKIHKNEKIAMYYKHNWWPILYSQKQHEILKYDEKNNRFYCINGSDTNLDKWANKFENEIGMHVKSIENFNQHFDFQVFGDIIIQFYIDPQIEKKIDNYFINTKEISDFNPKKFIDILNEKGKITVIVIRNEILSEQLKKEVFKKFEKSER